MRGWRRASILMKTHPLHPFPDVTARDLLLPSAADRLVLLGACLACGACLAVLWVYFPLFIVAVMLNVRLGPWLWVPMIAMTFGGGLLLFAIASARERRYADEI
jgi:hypothetical protein